MCTFSLWHFHSCTIDS